MEFYAGGEVKGGQVIKPSESSKPVDIMEFESEVHRNIK